MIIYLNFYVMMYNFSNTSLHPQLFCLLFAFLLIP